METQCIGRGVARVDALEKVTGQAVYGLDIELPGMLYGVPLRSPFSHARIIEIDISEALAVPGVRSIVTGKDFCPVTLPASASRCI